MDLFYNYFKIYTMRALFKNRVNYSNIIEITNTKILLISIKKGLIFMSQDPLTLYKLIILYILNKAKFHLTFSQISNFILEKEYTNYLTLQQVMSDLQEAELIKSKVLTNRTYFSITDEGRNTLSYFENRISDAIIQDIDTFLSENLLELRNESAITATYYMATSKDYIAELSAREKNMELINIKLSVPTEDMAETICNHWYNKNQQLYQFLMEQLL